MKFLPFSVLTALSLSALAADGLKSTTTHAEKYGATRNPVNVDPAKDLPRYPAVEPKDALATWQVKPGFRLELAAHEPQVRDPIAISFDERGRMFVCEMIDYSERREETPHLGRISMLEDKDGDGYFETSTVFADDLPWPTGLIFANGGLYVGATPDIWFFQDKDGDGRAEVREKIFTGFGTGLKLLNVQGMLNSFQWGQDNRIHVLAGGGNRGTITCLKRPDLSAQELGGQDFWFDPRTLDFGLEAGGAQYGMSFDDYGRKFGCSNSDHLQTWYYDLKSVPRSPAMPVPDLRASIAFDGGAAEVFRISPDEPWRIIRTRWRVAGVVKGSIEGGGRVSGYFTGATGTTIYRGDAYGPDFVNNSFTGDAGGQLVHRKIIRTAEDGLSLIGERPADERGYEFAASKDTWVRVVNFANAPDGCLHICDMYREVIEHPWSIPDEIKKHLDLNSGNDRGRIYRLVPDRFPNRRGTKVNLAEASVGELVETLSHPNGWHRDTAQRLLYQRQDPGATPLLNRLLREAKSPATKLHVLGALDGLGALDTPALLTALDDPDAHVRERGLKLARGRVPAARLARLVEDDSARVCFQLTLTLTDFPPAESVGTLATLLRKHGGYSWVVATYASPAHLRGIFDVNGFRDFLHSMEGFPVAVPMVGALAATFRTPEELQSTLEFVAGNPNWVILRSLGDGLKRRGLTIAEADPKGLLTKTFSTLAEKARNTTVDEPTRADALAALAYAPFGIATPALKTCLVENTSERVQTAAVRTLAQHHSPDVTSLLLQHWPQYGAKAKEAALAALVARDDRAKALLGAIQSGAIPATALAAAQVQSLVQHKDAKLSALAKEALAAVIPPSREQVMQKFAAAVSTEGDATRGATLFQSRCLACHRAGAQGFVVGPDLVTVKTKGREALLGAILEPNKEVASQFIAYTVNTKDGLSLNGIIARDDATGMTLKVMGGAEIPVPRANIQSSSSSGQSLMPDGLETGMTVQEMADLLTFIETLP